MSIYIIVSTTPSFYFTSLRHDVVPLHGVPGDFEDLSPHWGPPTVDKPTWNPEVPFDLPLRYSGPTRLCLWQSLWLLKKGFPLERTEGGEERGST